MRTLLRLLKKMFYMTHKYLQLSKYVGLKQTVEKSIEMMIDLKIDVNYKPETSPWIAINGDPLDAPLIILVPFE